MSGVGFIGLGIMGEGMAARLLSEGVAGTDDKPLVVWNRSSEKCTALADKFPDKNVVIKTTAKDVVEASTVSYSMLSTPEASKAVFEGEAGTLAGVSAGKCIVDCATLAEADMQSMNQAVVEKGGYVAVPSGTHRYGDAGFFANLALFLEFVLIRVPAANSSKHLYLDRKFPRQLAR